MSDNPDIPRRGEPDAKRDSADPPRGAGYDVGYGKPPKHTRFAKGQSGNPRGRPKKPKPRPLKLSEAPSDRFLAAEAYRPIALRENGQGIELPAIQAVLRSAHATECRRKAVAKQEDDSFCAFLFFAQLMDHYLPRRYRWQNDAELHLMMEYHSLSRREREQRIAAGLARLNAEKPRRSLKAAICQNGRRVLTSSN